MLRLPLFPVSKARRTAWNHRPDTQDEWFGFDKILNPTHDPIIDSLLQTLHTLKVTLNMLPPNHERTYWTHVGDDALYAEAIAPVLWFRAHEIIYLIRQRRIENIEDHLDLTDPLPDPDSWADTIAKDIKNAKHMNRTVDAIAARTGSNYFTDSDLAKMSLQFDIPLAFLPPQWPGLSKWNQGITELNEYYGNLFSPSVNAPRVLRSWRTQGAQSQSMLFESWTILINETQKARAQCNALNAQAARTRTLLVNDGIPKPNLSTLLAWYSICGLEVSQIDSSLTYICFTHPHMPVTTEHGKGAGAMAMQDESSNSSHSLPAKSGGHVRTKTGRIIHGRHEMWGVVFEHENIIHDMSIWVSDSLMTRPASIMRRAFSKIRPSCAAEFWGIHQRSIIIPITDPWVTVQSTLNGDWPADYPISTTFRSLAKNSNHHFMFTDDNDGMDSLEEWKQAFLEAFSDYMMIRKGWMPKFDLSSEIYVSGDKRTPEEALYAYSTLLSIQYNNQLISKYTTTTSKGKRLAFDFGDLSLPD